MEISSSMRLYLDCCCLNRPYDELGDDVVRMEAEAVLAIIDRCNKNEWGLCGSDVLLDEIENNPNLFKKEKVLLLYQTAVFYIDLTSEIVARAKELERYGIKSYDALHLASAEKGRANVFLTTDRKLVSAANRSNISIKVKNPLEWLTEILYVER